MKAPSTSRAALLLGLALFSPACKSKDGGVGVLAKAEPSDEVLAKLPVPPADGPKLCALAEGTAVMEKPSPSARKLGELRVGAVVARSLEPFSKDGCKGGWYVVRPKGFVCAGANTALDGSLAAALPPPPALDRGMPYRYGRARSENVPIYARVPTVAEQLAAEPDLAKVLKREPDKDPLGATANDVPLDARGAPSGPPVLLPGGDGIADGKRTVASYFLFPADAPAPFFPPQAEIKPGALRKGSGLAITGSLLAPTAAAGGGSEQAKRRFGVTADGRAVPIDRIKPALGTTWHGVELDKVSLPIAFVHKLGVHTYALQKGKAIKHEDDLERRAVIPLSNKFRTVDGVRFEETRDGEWVRAQDIVTIVKRSKFPEFARGTQKWLDVSIANQTLTAYEGTKAIFATLISSGRDQLKDPATTASTAKGTFHILSKHVTRARDAREVQNNHDLFDVPWVMEFEPGFALTGMYWGGDVVGEAGGFHDVAMAPLDAHRLFGWADPQLPEGWHAVYEGMGGESTIVYVRP
ncbi:MAG: L,D-transpeptidase [Byssovorax sp.]